MTTEDLHVIYKYSKNVFNKSKDLTHDFNHIERVAQNASKIIDLLDLAKDVDQNIIQAACLLHDVTFIYNKPSFRTWLFEGIMAAKILEKSEILNHLKKEERDILEDAVLHHCHAFPTRRLNKKRSLYCQILQDADTLDQFYEERIKKLKEAKINQSIIESIHFSLVQFQILPKKI